MSWTRCIAVPLVLVAALTAPAAGKPRLVVETGAGVNKVFAEVEAGNKGQVRRSLLRMTSAAVTPGVTGSDPAGRASFATWNEAGERWFTATQDGGRSWSNPRAVQTALLLLAGAVEPGAKAQTVPPGLSLPAEGRLFLVQFRTLSLPEWRAALQDLGAEVLNYFPYNAHIVRMSPGLAKTVEGLDFVERVEPYHPAHRLEPELRDWVQAEGGPADFRVRVMAFEWGPEGKERIRQAAQADGAGVAANTPSGHVIELVVNRGQLRRLAANDDVLWIDRWSAPENDMDLVRGDTGASFLETNFGTCGQGVRGEVLDGGFESTHQDFDGVILHGSNTAASHGTSTYGIVFGNGNRDGDGNAQGLGQLVCGAQGISADYDFLTDRFAHTQRLKNSPYFASFQSNSWGNALTTAYNSISSEMDDIIWRLDIAIAQSQSNAGTQSSRPQAWAKNVISVGGVYHFNTASTTDDRWNSGASIGPAADGRLKPDVHYWYDSIFTTTSGNTYTTGFGGTSAATPEVAGVLGLIVQMWSENVWGTNPQGSTVFERQPHASTIKALLINSAVQYPFTGTTSDLTRTHQGWGRPSARVARERAANSLVVDESTPLQLNQTATYTVSVPSGAADLKATMVYPDPPGTTSASLHRINNLNLRVTSPTGTIYWGNNGLNAGNWSTSGGSANAVDTVENVFVQNPAAGSWTVEVQAAEINQDAHLDTAAADAVFALVVTGGTSQPAFCGNGVIEAGEACDGVNLGGQTCQTFGFNSGTLTCNVNCTLNTSACVNLCTASGGSCTQNSQCCPGLSCRGPNGRKTCR
ncbi:MAG TPA: S8 family serine peptidase [Thermoanaerobaculia bacterium]